MGHLVFVYGTLKRGQPNAFRLDAARFEGAAVTVERYGMDRDDDGCWPRVYRHAPKGYAAPVMGEVYCVDDATLARLDRLEKHPDWYRREQVAVKAPGMTALAWLYFMPITHKTAAHDLFRRPVYIKGAARHCWEARHAVV